MYSQKLKLRCSFTPNSHVSQLSISTWQTPHPYCNTLIVTPTQLYAQSCMGEKDKTKSTFNRLLFRMCNMLKYKCYEINTKTFSTVLIHRQKQEARSQHGIYTCLNIKSAVLCGFACYASVCLHQHVVMLHRHKPTTAIYFRFFHKIKYT